MQTVTGTVIEGHRVASGLAGDPRFPDGTLALQAPVFAGLGFPIDGYYGGTLNVSIAPHTYEVIRAIRTFRDVKWHPETATEDFSFFNCRVRTGDDAEYIDALVYRPHPETKPEHFQDPSVLEIIAPRMEGIAYGMKVGLELPAEQLRVR